MRRALPAAVVLALAAPAAAEAACEPASGERAVRQSADVVVLARGSSYVACLQATGARTELDRGRVENIEVAGPWVAYSVRRNLRLVDAATARRFDLARLGRIGLEELALGPDGSAAWITIRMRRDDAVLTARDPGGRARRLDRSADPLVLLGLSLEGRTVRWRNGSRPGRATLSTRDPCLPRGGERREADTGEIVILEREPGPVSTPVVACVRASGVRIAIAEEEASFGRSAYAHDFAVAGRFVAFVVTGSTGNEAPGRDTLVVHDLRRRRTHAVDHATKITDVALTRGGLLTWRKDGRPRARRLR